MRDARDASDMSDAGVDDMRDVSDMSDARPHVSHASHVPQVISSLYVPQVISSHAPHAVSSQPRDPRVKIIGAYGGYRKTLSFGYVCLIYHATTLFCRRNYDFKNDALGKTTGQMVGAARSARQNIVEGSSRAGTSKETELRLYDVAKGSLEELAGDYEAFLIDAGVSPLAESDPRLESLASLVLDQYSGSLSAHDHGEYILAMRRRFAPFLESEDPILAANSILFIINRAASLLHRQMQSVGETFAQEGGFTERLSKARLAVRDAKDAASAPVCPNCGGPMRKMIARKGRNAGKPFWSCCDFPHCQGTRPWRRFGG